MHREGTKIFRFAGVLSPLPGFMSWTIIGGRASIFLVYSPPEMNIRTYPKVPQIEEKFSGEPTGYSGDPQIHPVGRASAIGLNIRIFDSEFIGF